MGLRKQSSAVPTELKNQKVENLINKGVSHMDDHIYFFGSSMPFMDSMVNKGRDGDVAKAMVKMWTNFAMTSAPTVNNKSAKVQRKGTAFGENTPQDLLIGIEWTPVRPSDVQILTVDSEIRVSDANDIQTKRAEFWTDFLKNFKIEQS